jgi:hypothetical protein
MSDLHLHIVSFDIPYPPTYGGVIDIFYQVKALSEAGVKIHLHAFEYGKGQRSEVLEKLCYCVHYYPRKTGFISSIGLKPYITASRRSKLLIKELIKDNYPILFEGLHTCYYINDNRLKERLKLFRATNIEHQYYAYLAFSERNIIQKFYFINAAFKLLFYQSVIRNADIILPVSKSDTEYFQKKFPSKKVITMPCFHANIWKQHERVRGEYVLFQGNLEVAENERAAIYLMCKAMNDIDFPFIIAGNKPSKRLFNIAKRYPNVSVVASPGEAKMTELINRAHIHLLFTYQSTGLKLKLLNALYAGSFVIANNKILHGTGLESLCYVGNTSDELKRQVQLLIKTDYHEVKKNRNVNVLFENYDIARNAAILKTLIDEESSEKIVPY